MSTAATATWPLRVALATRLTTHASTSALSWAPSGKPDALNTGRIGPSFGVGEGTFTREGSRETRQIDYWAATPQGAEEANAAIVDAVMDGGLTVTGFLCVVHPRLVSYEVIEEASEETGKSAYHAAARFEFILYKTP